MSATPDRLEVAARLAIAIGRINRLARPGGDSLSYGLLSALATIARHGPARLGDVATIEAVTRPTMTRVVADLEARGLVERADDPTDGRATVVSATPAGEAAVLDARAERARVVSDLLGGLADDELASIAGALDALELVADVRAPVR